MKDHEKIKKQLPRTLDGDDILIRRREKLSNSCGICVQTVLESYNLIPTYRKYQLKKLSVSTSPEI